MKAFKHFPLLLSVFTAGALAVFLSGCVYAGNKSWDELIRDILRRVEQSIPAEDGTVQNGQ